MTDDFRKDLYQDLYPYSTPRDYHYFKVNFTVFNTYTEEYNTVPFYISCKRSINWMESLISGRYYYGLPREYFTYSWEVEEVEDDPNIIFHHITTKESWEKLSVEYFLYVCATKKWKVDWLSKVRRVFKKFKKVPQKVKFEFS